MFNFDYGDKRSIFNWLIIYNSLTYNFMPSHSNYLTRTILICILYVACGYSLIAQCPTNAISLTTQNEIDNFALNYPGCTNLNVIMSISGPTITNLDGLSGIINISNYLFITNTNITSLSGLEDVTFIWYLDISNNQSLSSLQGLDNVSDISVLRITNNPSLTSFIGFNNLDAVHRKFNITNNSSLANFIGLEGLISVGSSKNGDGLFISGNHSLNNMHGLSFIDRIDGSLSIKSNNLLQNLNGLTMLRRVEQVFEVHDNNTMRDFNGLHSIDFCSELKVHSNDDLANMQGLSKLSQVSSIKIFDNIAMVDVHGLEGISQCSDIKIHSNPSLQNLYGFDNLTSCDRFEVYDNSGLRSMNGLSNLINVIEYFVIENNTSLLDLSGLEKLANVGNGPTQFKIYEFVIRNNSSLVSLNGLNRFTSADGDFKIDNNDALIDLTGLSSFSFARSFSIRNNNSLETLNGSNFSVLEDALSISNNPNLYSITGLRGMTNALTLPTEGMTITHNPLLSECAIVGICNFIENYDTNNQMYVNIHDNALGCNSELEIESICSCSPSTLYYPDIDGDGYGDNSASPVIVCGSSTIPVDHVSNNEDCNDTNPNNVNVAVNGNISSGIYEAVSSIESNGHIHSNSTAVSFKAGNLVCLNAGFVTEIGAVFTAEIASCRP